MGCCDDDLCCDFPTGGVEACGGPAFRRQGPGSMCRYNAALCHCSLLCLRYCASLQVALQQENATLKAALSAASPRYAVNVMSPTQVITPPAVPVRRNGRQQHAALATPAAMVGFAPYCVSFRCMIGFVSVFFTFLLLFYFTFSGGVLHAG